MYLSENALEMLCNCIEGGRRFEHKKNALKPFLDVDN